MTGLEEGGSDLSCALRGATRRGTGSSSLNKASSDRQRAQLHQAHSLYGAMKTHYLTHTRGEKHFTIVENYSCPGSVWLNKGSMPSFLLPVDQLQPWVSVTAKQFSMVTSRGYW